jgi:hypothetical protein
MANIKVKFKEAYQDFGAYALLKNVTDKGVLIVDGTEVLNSIADLPTTNTVDGQEKAVIVQNGQVITTSINNIGGETGNVFIPLTGTEVGKSVSGDIELNELVKLKNVITNNQREIYFTDDGYITMSNQNLETGNIQNLYIGSSDCTIYTTDGVDYTEIRNDINGLNIRGTNPLARGIIGQQDFSPNITDLDYTQKIYVDTHIAFTPIPTSSTDPGIKGQMAVDATYLYICVDTDTWARVALTW